jgi:hypothetical protein
MYISGSLEEGGGLKGVLCIAAPTSSIVSNLPVSPLSWRPPSQPVKRTEKILCHVSNHLSLSSSAH